MIEYGRYYVVDLYRRQFQIFLYEYKQLTSSEYTLSNTSMGRAYIQYLEGKEEYIGSLNSLLSVSYFCYAGYSVECNFVNDFEVDKFYYDAKKNLVVYGLTDVYVYKKNGVFYDVITDREIPDIQAHGVREIKYVNDFAMMQKRLSCVLHHRGLYEQILCDVLEKLSFSHFQYVQAYNEFLRKVEQLQAQTEKNIYLQSLCQDLTRRIKEQNLLDTERAKVRQLILDIQKGS